MTEFDETPDNSLSDAFHNLGDAPPSPNQESIKASFLSRAKDLRATLPDSIASNVYPVSSNGVVRPMDSKTYPQMDDLNEQEGAREHMKYLRYRGIMVAGIAAVFTLVMCSVILVASAPVSRQINEAQSLDLDNLQPITPQNISELTLLATLGDGDIRDVAWSPDGSTIAVAGSRGIHLHNADDLNAPSRLLSTTDPVSSIDYSSDGTIIAGIRDNDIWLWNAESGEVIRVITVENTVGFFSPTNDILYSSDGSRVSLTVCIEELEDRTIYDPLCNGYEQRIYTVDTGELVQTLDIGNVSFVTFNPDWSLLAYNPIETNGVYLMDVETGENVGLVSAEGGSPAALFGFTSNGEQLVVMNSSEVAMRRSVAVAEILENYDPDDVPTVVGDRDYFTSPLTNPLILDEWYIALTTSGDIFMADFLEPSQSLTINREGAWSISNVALSPDGSRVLAVQPSLLTIWDTETGESLDSYQGYHTGHGNFVFNQEDTVLYSTSWNSLASEWQLTTDPIERAFWGDNPATNTLDFVNTLRMHPTENIIAYSVSVGNTSVQRVFVRNLETGEEEFVALTSGADFDFLQDGTLRGLSSGINNLWGWSPDTGTEIISYLPTLIQSSFGPKITFSPDGRLIAAQTCDLPAEFNCPPFVTLFATNTDMESGDEMYIPVAILDQELLSPHYNSLHFSPDGNYLLLRWCTQPVQEIDRYGCTNYDVSIWDVRDVAVPETVDQPTSDNLERLPADMTLGLDCEFLNLISTLRIGTEDTVVAVLPCTSTTRIVSLNPATQEMEILYEFEGYVNNPGISHDNTMLAINGGGVIELWGIPE